MRETYDSPIWLRPGRAGYYASRDDDALDLTGLVPVESILSRGVDYVLDCDTGTQIGGGCVELGKKLRPNYREGQIVLYARRQGEHYEAVRVT